jgi:hypothetical protein
MEDLKIIIKMPERENRSEEISKTVTVYDVPNLKAHTEPQLWVAHEISRKLNYQ